jgi:non-specific serine/threonine protein kinase/serine/threonine-protein kinase
MTDAPRWHRAKEIFYEAAALEAGEREAFLATACEGDPDLHREVRSLLAWDEGSGGFLEDSPISAGDVAAAMQDDARIGQVLGAWRITAAIGRGGMGVVYRAERADAAFQKDVAIKVVRSGLQSAPILERFHRERATLAALDHPNIARLVDGGATTEGEPYFVMDFVDGVPIDVYCDRRRLTVRERLTLFHAVSDGVRYAHEHLVVHRDVKPDNILVSGEGQPKLLDFGVAKILSEGPGPADDAAAAATWLMTPDFASPEQMSGRPVTMATDVYSLGVLLHVLLTGTRPYRLTGSTPEALHQELAAATLPRPSQHVLAGPDADERAARRSTTPAALSRELSGDLDAIVRRAIQRAPADRYSSVEQLKADLDRHRDGYPVAARPRHRVYVAGRFARRHRVGLLMSALVAVLTVAGVAGVWWQARAAATARARAERRFDDVRRLARTFQVDVHDALTNVPGTTAARALLVKTTLEYLNSLAAEAADDVGLQKELAAAFLNVGNAQGNPTGPNVGDTAGALESYRRAIAIAEAIRRAAPDDREVQGTLANAHRRLGDALAFSGDVTTGVNHARASRTAFEAIAAAPEASVEDRLQAEIGTIKLGDLVGNPNFPNLGDAGEAAVLYDRALLSLRRLHATDTANFRVRRYLGLTLERIGTLHESAGRLSEAASAYQASFDYRRALADEAPAQTDAQRDLAIAYEKLGNVQRFAGEHGAAADNYRQAVAQYERLARADPSDANAERTVAIGREKLAVVSAELNRGPEAAALFGAALATHRRRAARDPENAQARCDLARLAEMTADEIRRAAPSGPVPLEACGLWEESRRTRAALQAVGRAGCVTPADFGRLAEKAAACPAR